MDKAVLFSVALLAAATGLGIGILLGSLLGRVGALEVVRTFFRLPLVVIGSPRQMMNQWRLWGEWRARRKIERMKFRNKLKELKEKIAAHRKEIRNTHAEMRHVRWQFLEPH